MGGPYFGTDNIRTRGWARDAPWCARSTGPSLESGLHKGDANEGDGGAGDEGWEDFLEDGGFRKRCADFEERA